jgi:vacuolar-type H+-ATPase subunit E/Vma4
MRVELKIEAFEQMAVKAAEEKRKQAVGDMAGRFKSSVEDELRGETQKAREQVQAQRYLFERKKNKQIVDASGKAKREFIEHREKLTEELFADVLFDIKAFTASSEYEGFLIERIKQAIGTSAQGTDGKTDAPKSGADAASRYEAVQLTTADMRYASIIKSATGLQVEEAADDFLGGFRLIGAGRRSVSDHTLAGQLTAQRDNFSMMIGESWT